MLLNPVMEGMVKIGRTRRTAHLRAKDLYTTGIPKKFIVLWHEFVHDSDEVEKRMHTLFSNRRVNQQREFFKVEPRDAIQALIEVALPFRFVLDDKSDRVSIFADLSDKYKTLLRKDIYEVNIAQCRSGVFLEVLRRPFKDPKREIIDYVDLDVLSNLCSEQANVSANAARFLSLDEYDLVNVTNLFEDKAAKAIWEKYSGT